MNLFIGCSSSSSIPNKYISDCKKYVDELFVENNNLVFGSCSDGLMGVAYKSALENKRDVIGICPEVYKKQLEHVFCTTQILTNTISDRTDKVIEKSDAIIFLPGGIGTVYELFTAIESKRSGEFDKPIVIYNSCGYFDKLFSFLDKIYEENFASFKSSDNYYISSSADDTLRYIKEYHYSKKITKN